MTDGFVYWSPSQIAESGKYPFTIGQVRHLLLFRNHNGLKEAVRKIGKRIVIRMDLFEAWIEGQREDMP